MDTEDEDTSDSGGGVVSDPSRPAPITVAPPSDDDDDDAQPPEGGDPAAAAALREARGEGDRGSRKSNKNQSRWLGNQAMQAELGRMNQTVVRLQREHTEGLRRMRDEILGAVQQRTQQPAQPAGKSPLDAQMGEIEQGLAAEIRLMRQHDPVNGEYDLTRYNTLRKQEQRLAARQEMAELGITPEMLASLRNGGGQQRELLGAEAQIAARFTTMSQEYPWMQSNEAAARAMGHYRRFLLAGGRPDNLDTDREAAMYVQRTYGLGPQRSPGGMPSQARRGIPAGGSEGRPRNGRAPITIDPALIEGSGLSMKQIAHALYSDEQ